MDDTEENASYRPRQHSSLRSKPPNRNRSHPYKSNYTDYGNDGFDDGDNEQEEENQGNVVFDEDDEDVYHGSERQRKKKRRLEDLVSNYEFAPRGVSLQKELSFAVQNSSDNWTENETLVLVDVWGDRFLQLGRRSLRSEDWLDVAEKVSEVTKVEKGDLQCRNRLDMLKKKYKKEKTKMEKLEGYACKWVLFKKMDALFDLSSFRQPCGLACGVDSGEYVFMDPRVYLDRSNGLDEMMDSPGESEADEADEEEDDGSSFRLLADSIEKFEKIYEKIETSKRQQMKELEKIRMDFQRELELQKKQILERAQAEITKIRQGDNDDDTDVSAENHSG